MFHLAAIYDLKAGAEEQEEANVLGTDHALQFAASIKAGCFHLASSIAAAGQYRGTFREDMFEEATGLEHPYFRTKHDSEALVRKRCKVPWRVYRPGIVVGHSQTGEIDKIDGPYYFFKMIQKMRQTLPAWFPIIGFEGGYINLVPVDFIADAMDHLAHLDGHDGECFHLTDPRQRRVGEVLNLFAKSGHAPTMAFRLDPKLFEFIPSGVTRSMTHYKPLQQMIDTILRDLQMPKDVLRFANWQTRFDSTQTQRLLEEAEIRVPPLEDYAWRLWDYWERHLDPDLSLDRSLAGAVRGKVVMITGGSSGIGLAAAERCVAAGAKVIIVARDPEKLEIARAQLAERGEVHAYACDIADLAACDAFAQQVLDKFGGVDVLVNNAGRSIRRSVDLSYDRFHDFERTMQLNYFAAIRLTMALLPIMLERRQRAHRQHIVHRRAVERAEVRRLRVVQGGARGLDALRRGRARRPGRDVHDHQHAAGPHADDRADQDLRPDAGRHAGRGRRHGGRGDHRPTEADRDATRAVHRGPLPGGAAHVRGHDEHRLQDVPGLRGRQGRGQGKAEGLKADA